MKESIKQEVLQRMLPLLDNAQAKALEQTLETVLCKYMEGKPDENEISSQELLQKFLEAKRIEGCSEKTLTYYQNTINRMLTETGKEVTHIMTEDLRSYLTDYQKQNNLSRVTVDNVRRILSSFFSWLEDEEYLIKSPIRRIHKVKTRFFSFFGENWGCPGLPFPFTPCGFHRDPGGTEGSGNEHQDPPQL